MSHFDRIAEAAPGFEVVAHTADCPIAATQNVEKKLYAVQFHPEACAGPLDTGFLFDEFMNMMEVSK